MKDSKWFNGTLLAILLTVNGFVFVSWKTELPKKETTLLVIGLLVVSIFIILLLNRKRLRSKKQRTIKD